MKLKFKKCPMCGNVVGVIKESGVSIVCCGKPMEDIKACNTEIYLDKHMPVYKVLDNKVYVRIGKQPHPSTNEHFVEWVALRTNLGTQRKSVGANKENEVIFPLLEGEKVESVYAYCNIHGLFVAE